MANIDLEIIRIDSKHGAQVARLAEHKARLAGGKPSVLHLKPGAEVRGLKEIA